MPRILAGKPWEARDMDNTTLDYFEEINENKIIAEDYVVVNKAAKDDFQWE